MLLLLLLLMMMVMLSALHLCTILPTNSFRCQMFHLTTVT